PDELGPRHIEGGIDSARLRRRIVLKNLDHQRRVIRDDHTGLQHAQKPCLVLGFAESPRRIDGNIRLVPLAHCRDRRERRANFKRYPGEDEVRSGALQRVLATWLAGDSWLTALIAHRQVFCRASAPSLITWRLNFQRRFCCRSSRLLDVAGPPDAL